MNFNGFYEFGSFQLNIADYSLIENGKPVPLAPKVFETLVLLIERRPRIITKEEIIAEIWHDTFVEESSLMRNISLLRKALGDNQTAPQFIETVPKRGYKFIAAVREYSNEKMATKKSLAVLPFKIVGDGEQKYLGLGMADALITRLSVTRQLVVRPTRTVQNCPEDGDPAIIGAEMQVEFVLDGRIMISEKHLRVTVQLTEVKSGETVWGDKFDEQINNIFEVQDSIAQRVIDALLLELTSDEQSRLTGGTTQNAAAYREYLTGCYFLNQRTGESLKKAALCFQNSITLDPRFVFAHLGIGQCYLLLPQYHGAMPANSCPLAKKSAQTALRLDPKCAEAFTLLGAVNFWFDRDWAEAERNFQKAIKLKPNYATGRHWYSLYLAAMGRFDQAFAEIHQALACDPLSPIIRATLGSIHSFAGQYAEAVRHHQNCLDLEPNFAYAWTELGECYQLLENHEKALTAFERAVLVSDSEPLMQARLAQGCAAAGRAEQARAILGGLLDLYQIHFSSPFEIALIYLELNELDEVFKWLETAVETHDYSTVYLNIYPHLKPLYGDDRFQDLLRRANLIED